MLQLEYHVAGSIIRIKAFNIKNRYIQSSVHVQYTNIIDGNARSKIDTVASFVYSA